MWPEIVLPAESSSKFYQISQTQISPYIDNSVS